MHINYQKHKILQLLVVFVVMLPAIQLNAVTIKDYAFLRKKRVEMLTGGDALNTHDPIIIAKISELDDEAGIYWNTLDFSSDTFLWSDLPNGTPGSPSRQSSDILQSFDRLKTMAIAYRSKGSQFKNNNALRDAIIKGMDWLTSNWYTIDVPSSFCIHFEGIIPSRLSDIMILMYDDLSIAQIKKNVDIMNNYNNDLWGDCDLDGIDEVEMTGANRLFYAMSIAFRGALVGNSEQLALARNAVKQVVTYVESGDGYYRDGSFIQHKNIPYNGGYGISLLRDIGDLYFFLNDSPWELTNSEIGDLFDIINNSYIDLMYTGNIMSIVRGRNIALGRSREYVEGAKIIGILAQFASIAPYDYAQYYKGKVKYWVQQTPVKVFAKSDLHKIHFIKTIMEDDNVQPAPDPIKHKQFPAMDRVVHFSNGYAFAIAMNSNRIANYEFISMQNCKGWHTSDGMTYLYNSDTNQIDDNFWPTVNWYRLPGTTVEQNSEVEGRKNNNECWVGGASISGRFGVTGMQLATYGQALRAKKSWFMFDDEIVALGSDISDTTSGVIVETIIDNHKIKSDGLNSLTINGKRKPDSLSWSEIVENVNWIHLEGNVQGSDIGYYFPEQATVNGLRESRTGNYFDTQGSEYLGKSEDHIRNFVTLWIDHGTNPSDASYSYVLLPGKQNTEIISYLKNPDIVILENSKSVQAVKERDLNIIAANFWTDSSETVDIITCDSKASVMVKENERGVIEVAVSDPTQTGLKINIDINKKAYFVIASDPEINVDILGQIIKLSVDVKGAKGKSFTLKLNTNPSTRKL